MSPISYMHSYYQTLHKIVIEEIWVWQWQVFGELMEHKGDFHKGQHRVSSFKTEKHLQLRKVTLNSSSGFIPGWEWI